MKNIIGIFVALFFASATHAQLVLPGAGGSAGSASSALTPTPQSVANNWFVEFGVSGAAATTTTVLAANTAYFSAIWFPTKVTINSLEVPVITGSGNCRIGILSPDGTTINRPGALVAQTASTSVASSATVTTAALLANAQVQGFYFKVIACDNSTVTFSGPPATSIWNGQMIGSATNTSIFSGSTNSNNFELSVAWTYANGNFPSSMSPSGSTCGTGAQACTYSEVKGATRMPFFGYQVTSIP